MSSSLAERVAAPALAPPPVSNGGMPDGAPDVVPGAVAGDPRPVVVEAIALGKRFREQRPWREVLRHPFRRRSYQALTDVSLAVREGEFFGILGPNGAGKTTLFRILATSIYPDQGEAWVGGHRVDDEAAHVRGQVSCVMANDRSLFWRLDAVENLRLYAALYGMRGPSAEARIREVLALVGLQDVGSRMAGLYSSGMRQRLLIARALLPRPRLLLLDEPTRSLDPIAAREFRHFLRSEIAIAQRCTVLLATHSSEEAMELCDRVAVLHRGRVLATGTARELVGRYTRPAYEAWTRTPEHPGFAALVADGLAEAVGEPSRRPHGWWAVPVALRTGHADADASRALQALVRAGADVARFEQADVSLAELLDRIVARNGTPSASAPGAP